MSSFKKLISLLLVLSFQTMVGLPVVIGPGSYTVGPDGRFMPAKFGAMPASLPDQDNRLAEKRIGENLAQSTEQAQPVAVNIGLEVRGCIKCQTQMESVPPLRVLFEGKEVLSNTEGFYSFPVDEQDIRKYSLVICKKIKQNFDKRNTLKNVSIIPDKDYHYFSFKRNPFGVEFTQREKTLNKKNFVIPQRCVVVLIDPKFVARIEPWKLPLPRNIIKLPTILLKNDIDKKVLSRAAAKSVLYSLDTAVFHEPVKEVVKYPTQNAKVAISLMQ